MQWHLVLFSTVGGLGLFIYGMTIMSESLKRIAGERMKGILAAVSTNRVIACLTGVGVTAVIQSSSGTTVMLVGFANAGLMTTTQAVGVALGAHVGTTVTAQLLAFNISELALPAIAVGSFMRVIASSRQMKDLGGFILGFGLLFYGMDLMKAGVAPIRESDALVRVFTKFHAADFGGILLCVLVGAACTILVQSSAVTVGLTMALASQGLLTLPGAMALVLGDNIGTTVTAELAALKTDLAARRMARTNTVSNLIGATYMAILFPFYLDLVMWFTQTFTSVGPVDLVVDGAKPNIARYVANAHTIFNVINAVVMVSVLPFLVRLGTALTPLGKDRDHGNLMNPVYLDEGSLKTTTVALSQSRKELVRMSEISQDMAAHIFEALFTRKHKDLDRNEVKEEALDSLQKAIHRYLVHLYGNKNTTMEQSIITAQMTIASGIERVGDTTTNIAGLIGEAIDHDVTLSEEAMEDYRRITSAALEFHEMVTGAMRENRTDILERAREMKHEIDRMHASMRDGHLDRLKAGQCNVDQGLVFTDMLNYFERMGNYLLKITRAWVELAATGL